MSPAESLHDDLLVTWHTSARVTTYLVENLPPEVWDLKIPGEGHHRGQIVMVARAAGHRLPGEVTAGLWQWSKRRQEIVC